MYYKRNKNKFIKKIKKLNILFLLFFFVASFVLGAYAHKKHFFYTFIKPIIFQNFDFIKKNIQGKFQDIDKVYLNIDFKTLSELNDRKNYFIKNEAIDPNNNGWLDISINFKNKTFDSKIRYKGRDPETHLNPSMRNENVSYKIKIKKKEDGNILGMREFNLMDLRRRGYLLEWYARKFLHNEGLIYLDYQFINLYINGKDHGVYVMDEAISEATLTRNKRRDSVAVRIDNNFVGSNVDLSITNPSLAGFNNVFMIAEIDTLNETIGTQYKELSNKNNFNQNYPISLNEKVVLEPSSKRLKNYVIANRLLNEFRNGNLMTEEVFDIEQLAKGFAASDIFDGWHGLNWTNLSFYFNPISLKLEPIFQDWYNEGSVSSGYEELQRSIRYLDVYNYGIFYKNIFSSSKFLERYVYYLEKYSNNKYFEKFNLKINNEFYSNLKKIYKSSPYYEFPYSLYERKINLVKDFIYHYDPVFLDLLEFKKDNKLKNKIYIELGNKHVLPIKVSKITIHDFDGKKFEKNLNINLKPRDLKMFTDRKFDKAPVKYQSIHFNTSLISQIKNINLEFNIIGSKKKFYKSLDNPIESINKKKLNLNNFLIKAELQNIIKENKFIDLINNDYIIKKGKWKIKSDLIIPKNKKLIISAGTELILLNNAHVISKSPIIAKGTPTEKIRISGIDEEYNSKNENNLKSEIGNTTFKMGQCIIILDSHEPSIFENVEFNNLRNCNKGVINSEGSLNVYKSNIKMKNILFSNNKYGDDGINFINSEFDLNNIDLFNIYADGIDLDYSYGKIKNLTCTNCLNDGVDISNTTLRLENFDANKIYDKALSIGENSIIEAYNININEANIGLAVKDGSIAKINNIKISESKYPITSYIKKEEFGPGELILTNLKLHDNINPILFENGTKYQLDENKFQKISKSNLFKTLYPNAEYRNLP